MKDNINIIEKTFENKQIRTAWDNISEKYYVSVIDVVAALNDCNYQEARNYWKVVKNRLKKEGNETVTNCNQLKFLSQDGKYRLTDVVDVEGMFRLIESIPSKKAEPIKLWLAHLGKERIDEEIDPEITINRALETYRKKGYSDDWINQRLKSIDARKEFTDELKRKGVNNPKDYAILTDLLTKIWSGYSIKEYKAYKGLRKENLRDNMTNMELVLNMLAETASTEISKNSNNNANDSVKSGGLIAKTARNQIEKQTGKKIVSNENNKNKYLK